MSKGVVRGPALSGWRRGPPVVAAALLLAVAFDAGAGPEDLARTETESFTFVYRNRFTASLRNTLAVAEDARAGMLADLGVEGDAPRAEVRYARNVEELRTLCPRPPPPWANAVAFWPDNVIVISLTSSHHRPVSLETVFRHELAHLVLRWAVGDAPVPRWFNEGLAIYQSGELPFERARVLWPAAASGRLIPLADLDGSFPEREFAVNLAYAQSADLVRYLVHRDGAWRLHELVARLRAGEPFDAALGASWNATVREIEREWKEDLGRRYSVVPSLTAGMTLWVAVGLLAVFAFVRRRREVRRRIATMADEPFGGEP